MGKSKWNNYNTVKNLVESNSQTLLTTKEEFEQLIYNVEVYKEPKFYNEIKIKVNCTKCDDPYNISIAEYRKEKLTCNKCNGKDKWTYEKIKEFVEQNNGKLLSSEESFNEQLNGGITPIKIKIDVKCNTCEKGVRNEVTINKYVTSNHRQCRVCTSKKLSLNVSQTNKKQWTIKEYRNKRIQEGKERTGSKNPRWNPLITDKEREIQRNTLENLNFRKDVYERDKYTCQICGDNKGGNLVVHHLNGWNWCIEQRYNLSNAITLCETCHLDFHGIYGYGDNTREQFEEYLNDLKDYITNNA